MPVKYWRTNPPVGSGTIANPANWTANTTWDYWTGSAWTAAPAGSTPGTNYPGVNTATDGDHVLVQSTHRVLLDANIDILTLTNITTGFPGTNTGVSSAVSGIVYNASRTLTCSATTSVAGTSNTNISATTYSLIYPITGAAGVSLTLGNSTNKVYIRGLLAGTTSGSGTIGNRDLGNSQGYTATFNIVGNVEGGTTYSAITISSVTAGAWTGTVNIDGDLTSAGYSTCLIDNTTATFNLNGNATAVGTTHVFFKTTGTSTLNLNTKTGGTMNLYGSSSTGQVIVLSQFSININMTGGAVSAGGGTAEVIGYPLAGGTGSYSFSSVSISSSTTANAIYVRDTAPTTFTLQGTCIVTSTTNKNAIVSSRLNADSTVIFKFNTGGGTQNTFQVSSSGNIPDAKYVLTGIAVGNPGVTGTLLLPSTVNVLNGVQYGIGAGAFPIDSSAVTGTLNIGASVWNYLTASMTTANSIGDKLRTLLISGTGAVTLGAIESNVITTTSINNGAITAAKFAANAIDSTVFAQSAADEVWASTTRTVGSVTGSVGSVTGAVTVGTNTDKTGYSIGSGGITSASFATDSITAAALATDAVTEIRDAIWNEFQNNTLSLSRVTRLHNASTVQTTGDQLASYNT